MSASGQPAAPRPRGRAPHAGPIPESLRREFVDLGLSPYEARVLLALLKVGSASASHLARVSGVHRTSTYQALEALAAKGLAERLPGEGAVRWTSPGRDEVLDRLTDALRTAQQEHLRQHVARTERVREALAEAFPEASPAVGLPYVHLIGGSANVKRLYEQLLAEAQFELLMFTRPPYSWAVGAPNPAVLEFLAGDVTARVLYQADQWEDPASEAFRAEVEVYHQAGVEARLVDELPIKLTVVDRRATLVVMSDPSSPGDEYPTTLHVEHPCFAEVQADAFERRWATGRPLT